MQYPNVSPLLTRSFFDMPARETFPAAIAKSGEVEVISLGVELM